MELTRFALLIALTQVPTMIMWFQHRTLRQDQIDALRNQKPVTLLLTELLMSERTEKQDLLNRLMSKDLQTYERMTVATPHLSDSTSVPLDYEQPRMSMSDLAEWAREQGKESLDINELESLSQDVFGM